VDLGQSGPWPKWTLANVDLGDADFGFAQMRGASGSAARAG
jgi:hypothetical protein